MSVHRFLQTKRDLPLRPTTLSSGTALKCTFQGKLCTFEVAVTFCYEKYLATKLIVREAVSGTRAVLSTYHRLFECTTPKCD
jgi:hypothetical protein